jgi:hypothetical protein
MNPETSPRSSKRWRRYAVVAVGAVSALGIFSAIGTNVVDKVFPSFWERVTGADSLQVYVADAVGANDGFAVATWSSHGLNLRSHHIDGCESLLEAAEEVGAVRVGRSYKNLVIEGGTDRDVTIVNLRAEILDRKAPMRGAQMHCQSAGGIGGIGISFDFDEPEPVARRVSEDADDGTPYFQNGDVIGLKRGEVQPIQITASATQNYVAWNLVADLVVDGDSETITIDEDGEPFRLTAGPPHVAFDRYYEWLWFEQPQRLYVSRVPFSP